MSFESYATSIGSRKKALVIAVSEYQNLPSNKQLPFCKNDGQAICDILIKQGYEIPENWKLIGKVTSTQLKEAIFSFFRKSVESKDTLFFYFSGHGIPDGHGGHYLATTDIDPELPDYNGFRFSELEDQANKSLAKKIVTVLDCCFSGAAGVKGSEEDAARTARADMERTFKEGDGKCVLASSLADQASYKMKGEPYSLFTYCLIEGLQGGKGDSINSQGFVTPSTLGNYVYHKLISIDGRQKPITKTAVSGDFFLAYYPEFRKEHKPSTTTSGAKEDNKSEDDGGLNYFLVAARDYFLRKDYPRAIIFFDRVLEIKPEHIETLNCKGISLHMQQKYKEAIECFDKVLKKDPTNIVALHSMENLKDKENSITIQKPKLNIKEKGQTNVPQDRVNEIFNDAMTFYTLGKFNEAIEYLDQVLQIDPDHNDAKKIKSLALAARNRYYNLDSGKIYRALKDEAQRRSNLISETGTYNKCLRCGEKFYGNVCDKCGYGSYATYYE